MHFACMEKNKVARQCCLSKESMNFSRASMHLLLLPSSAGGSTVLPSPTALLPLPDTCSAL